MPNRKKIPYKRIALAFSLCVLILWGVLGAGTSIAWFSDTSAEIHNIFHYADFDLKVSHRLADGSWEEVNSQTAVFDENALYEPGYLQIVYLKVKNEGDVPFKFDTAVSVNNYTVAINEFGQQFMLQDYLKFGVATADTEEQVMDRLTDREQTVEIADMPLHHYDETAAFELMPEGEKYIALIVRMPESVSNVANYRGSTVPKVELGITVRADQIKK